jgi:universal stress protein A
LSFFVVRFRKVRGKEKSPFKGGTGESGSIYKASDLRVAFGKGTAMGIKSEQKAERKALPFNIRNILVPVDFSDNSSEALKYAAGLAGQFGARVTLMHVVEPAPFMNDLRNVPFTLSDKQLELKADTDLEALALLHVEPGVPTRKVVKRGKAYREIASAAKQLKADLIVISTHGYTGLKHTIMGSTAERVVRHAGCAVLVLRAAK